MTRMEAVRRRYGVPAKRGALVMVRAFGPYWVPGRVTSVTPSQCVRVRPVNAPRRHLICHPTDRDVIRWEALPWMGERR